MSMVPTGQTAALLLVPSPVKQEQGVVGKTRVLVHCLHRASRCALLVLIVNDERSKDVKSLQADMKMMQVSCWTLSGKQELAPKWRATLRQHRCCKCCARTMQQLTPGSLCLTVIALLLNEGWTA